MTAVLRIDDLTRSFAEKVVLDGINMTVSAGELHAVLGPNGAGKTTLLRIIAGIADPSGGDVTVAGVSERPGSDRELRKVIGLVPSSASSFYMRLSGYENLLFFARLEGLTKRDASSRVRDLLALVGLEDSGDRRAGHYSNGMQRRLSVARSLLTNPKLLLVDEATQGLDPDGARSVRGMFRRIADDGTAVVWTTQRIDEIRAFADRVSFLHGGRFRFVGTVPELAALARPRHYILELVGDVPAAEEAVRSVATLEPVSGAVTSVFRLILEPSALIGDAVSALQAIGVQVVSCTEERSPIEEAFLALSGTNA